MDGVGEVVLQVHPSFLRTPVGLEDCRLFRKAMEPWEIEPLSEEEALAYERRSERMQHIAKVIFAVMMTSMMITWVAKNFFIALL